ncbi:MAG TPA: xanthine dehydrogenase family protein subunit M [Chloroflexi bacterium]|nr:xanthine dehydrogenase family protein subunit M [Chloroflexota bacterium]
MALWQRYLIPTTVEEALKALEETPGRAAVIAGGTDLLLDLEQGRHPPVESLIDLSQIEEMCRVDLSGEWVLAGAAVPLARLIEHPLIDQHAPCLLEACSLIGGPQVRNVATLGGNVGHALPAADGTIALLSLGAEAELASLEGRRWVPLESIFAGPGEPAFDRRREIIVRFRFPARGPGEGSAFERIMRPQGVAIAILNMSIWLKLGSGSEIRRARIALGPGGPVPFRAQKAEALFDGQKLDGLRIEQLAEAILSEAKLRTSPHRATEAYRRHLIPVLLRRTLPRAAERAGAEVGELSR